ncbi:MAG: hypothetical protein ABI946_04545 [Chthoniobacterales bacterium]
MIKSPFTKLGVIAAASLLALSLSAKANNFDFLDAGFAGPGPAETTLGNQRFVSLSALTGSGIDSLSPVTSPNLPAQVLVTPTVTFNGSVYTYSYSVMNGSPNTLAIVSFGAMPAASFTVQNLTAPMGFLATYDSGNGFVSFLEDNNPATLQTFAPGSTVSAFTFTSTLAPGATTFEALDIFGNTYTGVTVAPVPEPGVVALCFLALPVFVVLFQRRRNMQRASVSVS